MVLNNDMSSNATVGDDDPHILRIETNEDNFWFQME